jgi:predicted permease
VSWIDGTRHRLRELVRPSSAADELDEELQDHYARELERQAARRPGDAARATRLRAGAPQVALEAVGDERMGRLVSDLFRDLRFAVRGFRRTPGLVASVLVSFALGIGGTTAVFSLIHAVLLRPLPFPRSEQLHEVRVWWNDFSASLSAADLAALADSRPSAGRVGAWFAPDGGFAIGTAEGPVLVNGAFITPGLPRVLGVDPIRGHGLSEAPGAKDVLVGEMLWRELLGARPDVVGSTITLEGEAFTIAGVMPAGFTLPNRRDERLWVNASLKPVTRRGPYFLNVIARLPDDLPPSRAEAAFTSSVAPVMRDRYGIKDRWRYGVRPLKDVLVANAPQTLWTLFAAVVLVLLIGIANVANLLLARGTGRMREMSVRAAIGAARGRLVRQLLAETALLGAIGGVAGVAVAAGVVHVVRLEAAPLLPRIDEISVDLPVVAFALALGLATGLAAGVLPALRVPWSRLADALRAGGRSVGEDHRHGSARRVLVIGEIALAVTVVASAGLLVKTLLRVEGTDPGFRPEGVLSFQVLLPDQPYAAAARTGAFVRSFEERLRAIPGVRRVSSAMSIPPNTLQMSNNYTVEGREPNGAGAGGVAEWNVVTQDYFATLGIRVVRGRTFDARDREDAPLVAVVSESFARRNFPGLDPIGRRLKGGDWDPKEPWVTIVGLVADVPYEAGAWGGAHQMVYTPYPQNWWLLSAYVVVNADSAMDAVLPPVRRALASLDPRIPLRDVMSMTERVHRSAAIPRVRGWLFTALAALGLMLAITGIYGVMSYDVDRRRRETAIRRALGARGDQVVGATLYAGARLALVGVAVGTAATLAVTRSLSSLLFRVEPRDPAVILGTGALLMFAAFAACAWPAIRAARQDPALLLREE